MNDSHIQRVAIVGAGPAGICAAKHLYHNKYNDKKFDIVVYERQDQVGGIWIYNKDQMDVLDDEMINPVYKELKTNLPIEVMQYPDYPIKTESNDTYWFHADFCKYLQDYANNFNVRKFIKFKTNVTLISPLLPDDGDDDDSVADGDNTNVANDNRFVRWKVLIENMDTGNESEEYFDAIILCNGIHSIPNYAPVENLENFKGEVLHSKHYDDFAKFQDKIAVFYGHGPSTADLVVRNYEHAKVIYISARSERLISSKNYPERVVIKPNISEVNEDGEIVFEDGTSVNADILVFCTGYKMKYPLSPECQVKIEDALLTPAYQHMFHAVYPSMVFLSLATFHGSCLFNDYQCDYITAVFSNERKLPTTEEMLADIEKEISESIASGKPRKMFHVIGLDTIKYSNIYASYIGREKYPAEKQESFEYAAYHLAKDFYHFSIKCNR